MTLDMAPVLNPTTPLTFMPPEYEIYASLNEYILIGSISVRSQNQNLIASVLDLALAGLTSVPSSSLPQGSPPFYFKFLALSCVHASTLIFATGDSLPCLVKTNDRCKLYGLTLACLFFVNRMSTNTLFYARIYAVDKINTNKYVLAFCGLFWLFSAGGGSLVFVAMIHYYQPPNAYGCTLNAGSHWQILLLPASEALFDLLVCIVMTYKISRESSEVDNFRSWRKWFGQRRNSNTRIADRLRRDNQMYFSLTACIKIPEIIIIILALPIPKITLFQSMLIYPDVVVTNILVTRIYRNMKLRRKGLVDFGTTDQATFPDLDQLIRIPNLEISAPSTGEIL
ncbi:hypothetical protein CPB83DRAFT_909006 [Crepidotus variabilis]|uniref:Uncharacterized protein n=1 Tax=Crepidotus variabilis TaxID=179855 RepID=A0A9P6EB74_9AGAR|nr:hypothetical protein CPB83DRAFT_909006 [Crepidotus variabilis]